MRKLNKNARGFTLIELMIVVAIIGILAAIAIPNFLKYQLRAKSGEAPVNLSAIKTSEIAYYGSHDFYLAADPNPTAAPSTGKQAWDNGAAPATGWDDLGWKPEGSVYFQYVVEVTAPVAGTTDGSFAAYAVADIDADNTMQCWLFQKQDSSNNVTAPTQDSGSCNAIQTTKRDQVYKACQDGVF
jgi:type IV pilus assembly protein PilA